MTATSRRMTRAVHVGVMIIGLALLIVAVVAAVAAPAVMIAFTVAAISRVESDNFGGRASLAQRRRVTALCARRDRLGRAVTVDRDDQRRCSRMECWRPGHIAIAGGPAQDQQTREEHARQL